MRKLITGPTLLILISSAFGQAPNWPQWGGPSRNFMVDAKGLAAAWPEAGPKRLWSRELGEGHSSIVVDGNRLYTMYSRGDTESVISLDAATGKTVGKKAFQHRPLVWHWRTATVHIRRPPSRAIC